MILLLDRITSGILSPGHKVQILLRLQSTEPWGQLRLPQRWGIAMLEGWYRTKGRCCFVSGPCARLINRGYCIEWNAVECRRRSLSSLYSGKRFLVERSWLRNLNERSSGSRAALTRRSSSWRPLAAVLQIYVADLCGRRVVGIWSSVTSVNQWKATRVLDFFQLFKYSIKLMNNHSWQ